ncbi:MAG: isoprenylcysteine carboxylmethyltransferase family protein [Dehalococcoidia bacterium]|nr:isoprenylcysteine carboxylmethyltransferase family protein [Dehalococcoidia bacterium]
MEQNSQAAAPGRASWQRVAALGQDVILIAMCVFFTFAHASAVLDGRFASVPFAVEQGLLAVLFLTRRRSIETSRSPWDWAIAATSWLPMLARPVEDSGTALASAGLALQVAGLSLTIVGFSYLGRSFGIVAANRGLKVRGPYQVVRHPIYLSHTITMGGFVMANPSAMNAVLVLVAFVGMVLRIRAEENLLVRSSDYAQYRARVRWRLVPGVF